MDCAVVDYGSGNVRSVVRALNAVAEDHRVVLTACPEEIAAADHVVLPGVGAFGHCWQSLTSREGVLEALRVVREKQRPFLGICVGMQLLADYGEEHGRVEGLGWIGGRVRRFDPERVAGRSVPHIGWSRVRTVHETPLMDGIGDRDHPPTFYFVHSYLFETASAEATLVEADYGEPFAAVVGCGNVFGTQFHPEKSQRNGLALLANFLRYRP